MEYDVTGITTFCMNDKFVNISLGSFFCLYPQTHVVVVDNSEKDHLCAKLLRDLSDDGAIELIANNTNLGHGKGLLQGMERVKTKYALIFDSDVYFKNGDLIPDMINLMDKDAYGVGFVMWHGNMGQTVRPHIITEPRPKDAMKYLHPFCMLLSVEQYKKWPEFDSFIYERNKTHGAPMMTPMRSIYDAGKEDIIKHLPKTHYVRCKYWNHTSGGSRMALRELDQCP